MESSKLVHLVRHAQAEHNLFGISRRKYDRVDPGLTDFGWQQVEQLRERGVSDVELVVVSPLTRTLQTAIGVFGGGAPDSNEGAPFPLTLNGIKSSFQGTGCPPFIAAELCREFLGVYEANKRSPINNYWLKFPAVDFSLIKDEEDILWDPRTRERREAVNARAVAFLQWLMDRKETNVAVVSHGGFLSTLWGMPEAEGRPSCVKDEKLSSAFLNCELRTVTLKVGACNKSNALLSKQNGAPCSSLPSPSVINVKLF